MPIEAKKVEKETDVKEVKEVKEVKAADVNRNSVLVVDVRTVQEFKSGAYPDAINIPLDDLMTRRAEFGENPDREIIVYCASGGRSAYAQRMLMQMGYTNVTNGGGLSSMMARRSTQAATANKVSNGPLVVDVRSAGEFSGGAYPGAVNIPLDELPNRINELGDKNRDITLYCASGARSAYGQQVLQHLGFSNVKNGGGLMHMMMRR